MTRAEKIIAMMADGETRTAQDIALRIGDGSIEPVIEALVARKILQVSRLKGVRVFRESYSDAIAILRPKERTGPTAEDLAAERERLARKAGELKRDGMQTRHIAAVLGVSETTARRYVRSGQ